MNGASQEKILILTGALGDGHNQAAQALLEAAGLYRPDVEVVVVDFMSWTHPYLHSIGRFCYLQWLKTLPSLYGFLYRRTRERNMWSSLFKRIRSFRTYRMLELLRQIQPTRVVSTFPGAAAAMSVLRSAGMTDIPTVTVITDYTVHSYWIHPCTDSYIVGAEKVGEALLEHGVPDAAITVTGIPIRLSFASSHDRKQLCHKHGLDPALPTVLVMGGGDGLIGRQCFDLLHKEALPSKIQLLFVCGRNERLRQQLVQQLQGLSTPHCVHLMGYVNHVHELMAMSDLIVTKPGGLTVSEALALELPMLLYKPLPGQEQDNAAFLRSCGAAMEARNTFDLKHQLQLALSEPDLLLRMKRQAKSMNRKHGSRQALSAILQARNQYVPHPKLRVQTAATNA